MHKRAECWPHKTACLKPFNLTGDKTYWEYSCPECGLMVIDSTIPNARTRFWVRAEKLTVRRLVQRRTAGEKLKENEKLMVGHSPFGDANSHNF